MSKKYSYIGFQDDEMRKYLSLSHGCSGELRYEKRESVLRYLKNGFMVIAIPRVIYDIFERPKVTIGRASIYTDGEWIWPDYFVGYYRKYPIGLPEKFFTSMRARQWQPPNLAKIDVQMALQAYKKRQIKLILINIAKKIGTGVFNINP